MAVAGPTLMDLLLTVHPLLLCCVPCDGSNLQAIKVLRLVSKEISGHAGRAARQCSLQLGESVCLQTGKVVLLMKLAQLERLHITINTSPVCATVSTLAQQLETCTSQLGHLLQGLCIAIKTVTTLNLRVTYNLRGRSSAQSVVGKPALPPRCPASFSQITSAISKLLAQALPALQDLQVEGCCEDAAFDSFGAFCPHLTHLQIDPTSMPSECLETIDNKIDSLSCLTLKTPRRPPTARPLEAFVEAALASLQGCKSLSKLVLNFDEDVVLICKAEYWGLLPGNVQELVSTCNLLNLGNARPFVGGLRTLSIPNNNKGVEVFPILRAATNLQHFFIAGKSRMLIMQHVLEHLPALKQRMLQGLNFVVPGVLLRGFNTEMHVILASLPTLPSVHLCTIELQGIHSTQSLADVARIFPNLTILHLWHVHPSNPGLDMQQLEDLRACTSLRQLRIRGKLSLTNSELVDMCQSMPGLEVFGCMKQINHNRHQLGAALAAHGQTLQVELYTSLECHGF